MKLKSLFSEIVKIGIDNDPRSKNLIKSLLDERKKQFKGLSGKCKEYFDKFLLQHEFIKSLKKRYDQEGINIPFCPRFWHD